MGAFFLEANDMMSKFGAQCAMDNNTMVSTRLSECGLSVCITGRLVEVSDTYVILSGFSRVFGEYRNYRVSLFMISESTKAQKKRLSGYLQEHLIISRNMKKINDGCTDVLYKGKLAKFLRISQFGMCEIKIGDNTIFAKIPNLEFT